MGSLSPITLLDSIGCQRASDVVCFATFHSPPVEDYRITYTYDPLYRLTSAAYSTGESFAYAYDDAGNRTAMTDTAGAHSYTLRQAQGRPTTPRTA